MRWGLVFAAIAVAAVACGGRSADRTSPERTLDSFFAALAGRRFPGDLDQFLGEQELAIWRMRCADPGCDGGSHRVVDPGERSDVRAVLLVDYTVDARGVHVMRGERSPIALELDEDGLGWRIVSFGRQRQGATRGPGGP